MANTDISQTPTLQGEQALFQRLHAMETRLAVLENRPVAAMVWATASVPPVSASSVPVGARGFCLVSKTEYLSDGGVWHASGAWS